MKRPRYSPEFKADAIRQVMERGIEVAEVARDLGVREPLLRRWVHQEEVRQEDEERLAEVERANAVAEIEKLQAELPDLLNVAKGPSDRMKSLTNAVLFRDAARRLRAEIRDAVGRLQVPTSIHINASIRDMQPGAAELSLAPAAPSIVEAAGRGSAVSGGRASATLSVNPAGARSSSTGVSAGVEQRLSERPEDIRAAARALSQAIAVQIEVLNAQRPNDHEPQARHDEFVAFLREIAARVDALAESLDRAIAAKSPSSRVSSLTRSREIVGSLGTFVAEGFEEHRAALRGCAVLVPVLAASVTLLHALGVDANIAVGIVATVTGVKSSKKSKSRSNRRQRA